MCSRDQRQRVKGEKVEMLGFVWVFSFSLNLFNAALILISNERNTERKGEVTEQIYAYTQKYVFVYIHTYGNS